MKKRSNTISLLLLVFFWGCTDNAPRNPSPRHVQQNTSGSDTVKNIARDSVAQRARWVDYVNYTISRHALLNSKNNSKVFDSLTRDDKSYESVVAALTSINAEANVALCNEINELKKDALVQRNTDTLPIYFSHDIFSSETKYAKITAFCKKRLGENADSLLLFAMQADIKKNMQDSIKDVVKTGKDAEGEIPDDDPKPDSSTWVLGIAAIIMACTIAALMIQKNSAHKSMPGDDASKRNLTALEAEIDSLKNKVNELETEKESLTATIQRLKETVNHQQPSVDKFKATSNPASTTADILYFPAPNGNSFPASAGSSSKRSLDIYQAEINGSKGMLTLVLADNDVVKRALNSPDIYILPFYEIEGGSSQFNKAAGIKILEPALLQQETGQWVIKTKGLIKLL
jgi:hypothetical protein